MTGFAEREWSQVGAKVIQSRGLTLVGGQRLDFAAVGAAIESIEWQEIDEDLPALAGMALRRFITEMKVPAVTRFGIGRGVEPLLLYGIEAHYGNGRVRLFVLDIATHCVQVASDLLAWRTGFVPFAGGTEHLERDGAPFKVLRVIATAGDDHDPEVLPMYQIRFEDGVEIDAWPEEVLPIGEGE